MIRVDAVGRMDVDYDEVSDALGEEPGYFDAAEFEENMSTHYGRMIHLDDRTIMFANPEDAAEYLGFDLTPHGLAPGGGRTRSSLQGGTVYEKDGEKYFVVDSHMHYWNAAPDNWVPGAEQYAKGWIECFHAYQSLGPPETHWTLEHFQKYSEDDLMKDVFEDGHVDVAIFQPTYLKEWYTEGFNTTERNARWARSTPASSSTTPGSTRATATRA